MWQMIFSVPEEFFCGRRQRGVGADFRRKRMAAGYSQRGQQLRQPRGFVRYAFFRNDALVVTKLAAQKTAGFRPAQPLSGADEKTQDGAAVVAGKIHRPVETFATQRADDRPGLARGWRCPRRRGIGQTRSSHGKMLKQRRDFFRHEQMKLGLRIIPRKARSAGVISTASPKYLN